MRYLTAHLISTFIRAWASFHALLGILIYITLLFDTQRIPQFLMPLGVGAGDSLTVSAGIWMLLTYALMGWLVGCMLLYSWGEMVVIAIGIEANTRGLRGDFRRANHLMQPMPPGPHNDLTPMAPAPTEYIPEVSTPMVWKPYNG